MCWLRAAPILLLAGNALAAEGWVVGVGGEADSADGLAGTVIVDVAVAEKTWLTGSIGGSTVELPRRGSIDTLFGDLGVDHWFDPVGVLGRQRHSRVARLAGIVVLAVGALLAGRRLRIP